MREFTRQFEEPFRNAPLAIKPYCTRHTKLLPAAASACSQANTHTTFPFFTKCRDKEIGLCASQLTKVILAMQRVNHQKPAVLKAQFT